jgi:hypothetical protein
MSQTCFPGYYPEVKFSRTKYGNPLLIDQDGFSYCMNMKKQSRIYWICNKVAKHKCRGSAITQGFYIVKSAGADGHTHSPEPGAELIYDDDLAQELCGGGGGGGGVKEEVPETSKQPSDDSSFAATSQISLSSVFYNQ